MRNDIRTIFRRAVKQGFRVEGGSKGWKIYPPDPAKGIVVVHGTPSDNRAIHNIEADLRRAGYEDGRRKKARPPSS